MVSNQDCHHEWINQIEIRGYTVAEERIEMSMEELFEKRASQQMVSEANAFKTVPKGVYALRATQYKANKDEKKENRTTIWVSVDLLNEQGVRLAKSSFKMSPDERRSAKGFLDGQSKLYGQVLKALWPNESDAERANHSAGEVVQLILQTPLQGFVSLTFKGPKNTETGWNEWLDAKDEAEEAEFRKRGYQPSNMVRSIQAVK